ncbi:MAG: caspase family protein, partial [Verrucomicrobiales bacterium]|nr:caspase family protein [Verrucomicrobiales bacterium]
MKTKRANPHSKLATPPLEGQGTKNIPATARAARRRALVVGINDYQGDINDLPSCRRDAEAFAAVLRTQLGFTEISVLLDRDASVARVKGGLEWLFADVSSDDRLVFYYSGHGTQNLVNGEKEEYLVLHDGLLQDNEISRRTQALPDGVFTMVFDSCFSGGMEKRLFEIVENPTASAWKAIAGGSAIPTERARVKAYLPDPKVLRELVDFDESHRKVGSLVWGDELRLPGCVAKSGAKTGSEVGQVPIRGLLLSACDENEVASASSSATQGMSAFTFALLVALERLGSGAPTTALVAQSTSILRSLGFRQTPRLKAPGACAGMADAPFINLPRIHGSGAKEVSFNGWGGLDPFGWNRPWGGIPWPGSGLAGDWIRTAAALKGDDSTGSTKFLGIDAAILIPAVVQVVTALAKNQTGGPEKSLLGDALRLAGSVIKGPSETSAVSKLFGIDDAILI